MNMLTVRAILIGTMVTAVTLSVSGAGRGGLERSLSADAKEALISALSEPEGEYAAHAQYSAIIAKFGEVQPYVAFAWRNAGKMRLISMAIIARTTSISRIVNALPVDWRLMAIRLAERECLTKSSLYHQCVR